MSSVTPNAAPRRILVRGVNWLGDAVMTTPALARLREKFPHAHLTLLSSEKLAQLWHPHASVDEVISFAPGEGLWQVAGKLRARRFDTALVLPNSTRSALECWLARIPRRFGAERTAGNWLLTKPIPERAGRIPMRKRSVAEVKALLAAPTLNPAPGREAHQLFDYLHLVAEAFGADPTPLPPFLQVADAEIQAVRGKFKVPDGELLLGLNPGAEYGPAKRWPEEHFVAAAREITARTGARWLVFGGAGDADTAGRIAAAVGTAARSIAGQTSLRELMALLRLCRVLLTNDTGPMHVAAALGTPVVVPFGSTSPELTGPGVPGDKRHHWLRTTTPCAPCFLRECPIDLRCLRGIAPARAAAAVIECLASP